MIRGSRIWAVLFTLVAVIGLSASGVAAPPPPVVAEIAPVFETAPATLDFGFNEVVVRLQNRGAEELAGELRAVNPDRPTPPHHTTPTIAPLRLAPGAAVTVKLPVEVVSGAVDVELLVAQKVVAATRLSTSSATHVLLVDASASSRLRAAIGDVALGVSRPTSRSGPGGAATLAVATTRFDPATGDPVLPDRAASYASATVVLVRSDVLARLTGVELEALAGWVVGGGTLALVVARPEDLRHPTVAALLGGAVVATHAPPEVFAELRPVPRVTPEDKVLPHARNPSEDTQASLSGFVGGNLSPSPYGASAAYGLGEVHVLAFDPGRASTLQDPWALGRIVDLTRRAHDRRHTHVFDLETPGASYDVVRRELDPNESVRWAVAIAALLICLYAVLAGPVNFARATSLGRPLVALRGLFLASVFTFLAVVVIGVASRGITGRARHLTLVEAGAGMQVGAAVRWRGFYSPRAAELSVRTTDPVSFVSIAVLPDGARNDALEVDRDGSRLVRVPALPWQTVVVREDGFASLGDGVAMVPAEHGEVTIVNRTGRDLRDALVRKPSGDFVLFARIPNEARVDSSAGAAMSSTKGGLIWQARANTPITIGPVPARTLQAGLLAEVVDPELAGAWEALERAGTRADWFPADVPVLLAQIDGGEGRTHDSGLGVDKERLLVRIVGYGGKP